MLLENTIFSLLVDQKTMYASSFFHSSFLFLRKKIKINSKQILVVFTYFLGVVLKNNYRHMENENKALQTKVGLKNIYKKIHRIG